MKKILIADDSEFVHHICKARLAHCKHYVILSAMNGHDAYSILLREDKIDLIILDLNMPLMNGIEFMKKMCVDNSYKHTPVIILSTDADEGKMQLLRDLGVWAFVEKSKTHNFNNIVADAIARNPSPLLEYH